MRKPFLYVLPALMIGLLAAVIGCDGSSSYYKSTRTGS